MITSVKVIHQNGSSWMTCVLDDPESSGYALTSIEGISPGKANINIKDIATLDGGVFQNSRLPVRNIVLNYLIMDYVRMDEPPYALKYEPIEKSRKDFYNWFGLKKLVTIIIETDYPLLRGGIRRYMIQGYVESVEPDIFSQEESIQVSVVCPRPYFQLLNSEGDSDINVTAFNQGGSFTFPWSNPWFRKTIEFGLSSAAARTYDILVDYEGDIDTGVIYTVDFIGAYDNNMIWFEHYGVGLEPELETTMRFNYLAYKAAGNPRVQAGDKLVISTMAGKKSAILYHAGTEINVFSYIEIFDDWIALHQGVNRLRVRCPTFPEELPNIFVSMEYPILCSGV